MSSFSLALLTTAGLFGIALEVSIFFNWIKSKRKL